MAGGPIRLVIASKFDPKGINSGKSALKKFGGVAAAIGAASVAAIAGIGTAALRMSSEFETSFAKIQGLVGVSTDQLGELEDAAKTLGPQFGRSAQEAADALFFITSAGLRGADAVTVLEASLKGAAAGLGDTKTIADLATSAVNAYGASQLDGAQAVDVLTEAVREGKLEPAALAGAMGQVLPLASALGVGFNEVGAAMAAMSRTGTDASTASTQLRQILASLTSPTAEANEALAGMGLSAEGLRQEIKEKGLFSALETLTGAFDGNIEATASVFGNVRALSGVLDLMGPNVEGTAQIFANMTDDVGALDDAFAAVEDTAGFKMNKALETAKVSLLGVGDILLPIAARMLDSLMPVIDSLGPVLEGLFTELEPVFSGLAGMLPGLMEALMPLLPIIGDIAGVFFDLVAAILPPVIALLDVLMPLFADLTSVLGDFIGDALDLLAPVLMDIADTLEPIIAAAFPIFMTLLETLIPIILELVEMFLPLLDYVLPVLEALLVDVVLPALARFAEVLSVVLPIAMEVFKQAGLGRLLLAMGDFADDFGKLVHSIRLFFAEGMNLMIEAMEKFINGALRGLNWFIEKANSLPGVQINFRAEMVEFDRISVPGQFDNMSFPEVDVTGITDNGRRGIKAAAAEYSSLFEEAFVRGTMQRAGVTNQSRAAQILADRFGVPAMADGGMVSSPTFALIGEAGPEAVVPLDQLGRGGATYNITVNAGIGTNGSQVGEQILSAIRAYERTSGPVFARA